jgi:hypothetical protein
MLLHQAGDPSTPNSGNDAAARAKGVKRMCIPIRSTKSAERRRKQEEALVPQQLEVTHRVARGASAWSSADRGSTSRADFP